MESEEYHFRTLEDLGQGVNVRTVHMYFYEFIPDRKEGLVSGPCSFFKDVIHNAILDPAWTSNDDCSKRSGSVGY